MHRREGRLSTAILNRPILSMLVLVLILLAGVSGAFVQAKSNALEKQDALFDQSEEALKYLVQLQIGRSLSVPEVLETSSTVRALLLAPDAAAVEEQNEILEKAARNIHVDVIYVMDRAGNTLAASNWRSADSFVGKNYAVRPYFQQAIAGGTGRYIAKGITSHKVGYYLSRPVLIDAAVRGVVVVKVSLDSVQARVEQLWQQDQKLAILTDENTVVTASPLPALMFKAMESVAEPVRKMMEATRQYGGPVDQVALSPRGALDSRIRLVEFKDLADQLFLQKSYQLPDFGLRLFLHVPAADYWTSVAEFTGMFSLVALVFFLISVGVYQRWAFHMKLLQAAIRDPLTGLHTRLYMNDWCQAAMRTHDRDAFDGFALVMFDLDLFKRINDNHGHLAGDAVLEQVGAIIEKSIRGGDLAVRFGGEELAVFVRCPDESVALTLAERVRHGVEQTDFQSENGRMPVTLSGGVAYHVPGEGLDALFARADRKLYAAKKAGRNRICGDGQC